MVILLPVLVLLVGVLMWALCVNPKLQEIGRIAFFCGLLGFSVAYWAISLLGK